MSTTLTASAARSTVTVPTGTDVVSLAAIVAAIQANLNRSEWAAKSLIVPAIKAPDISGNDLVSTTSFATVSNTGVTADFALTLAVGDMVFLDVDVSAEPSAVNYGFTFRWYDSVAASAITEIYVAKGSAWSAGETVPIRLGALHIAAADGARTFSFQSKADHSSQVVTGGSALQARCIHVKLGAA